MTSLQRQHAVLEAMADTTVCARQHLTFCVLSMVALAIHNTPTPPRRRLTSCSNCDAVPAQMLQTS